MGRKSKYDKEMEKDIKDFEKFIHRINKKIWTDAGLKPPWEKEKRKKKKISDVSKSLDSVHRKLDKIINENVKLKDEIKDIKSEQKKQKVQKLKEEKPKSIIELQREGGNIIDIDKYKENEKLKEKLEKNKNKDKNKKETK